jgi:hypothetical protein
VSSDPIVGLLGAGLVGAEVARLVNRRGCRVAAYDRNPAAARPRIRRYGAVLVDHADDLLAADVVVLCGPSDHTEAAGKALAATRPVVSVSDNIADVRALLGLLHHAEAAQVPMVIGAAMSPGLSGLLARRLFDRMHRVDELHVAVHGTGGPVCAAQHHRALGATGVGWHDGEWIERPGGSGRELCWFPEPIGPHDCYRAELPDPLLLHHIFPAVERISARVSATRRDRMTARLPMLTPPRERGYQGAVRVEARGATADGARVTEIIGSAGRAALLAGAVCAATTLAVLDGRFQPGVHLLGGDSAVSKALLDSVFAAGVGLQEFTGDARPATVE